MKAVFRHELSSYFTGMTGYVFGAFLLLFAGIYTMAVNLNMPSLSCCSVTYIIHEIRQFINLLRGFLQVPGSRSLSVSL